MSMQTLERVILASAKIALNNPKLRLKDIMEWSTGDPDVEAGEVLVKITDPPGISVVVKKECDKRKP